MNFINAPVEDLIDWANSQDNEAGVLVDSLAEWFSAESVDLILSKKTGECISYTLNFPFCEANYPF